MSTQVLAPTESLAAFGARQRCRQRVADAIYSAIAIGINIGGIATLVGDCGGARLHVERHSQVWDYYVSMSVEM